MIDKNKILIDMAEAFRESSGGFCMPSDMEAALKAMAKALPEPATPNSQNHTDHLAAGYKFYSEILQWGKDEPKG